MSDLLDHFLDCFRRKKHFTLELKADQHFGDYAIEVYFRSAKSFTFDGFLLSDGDSRVGVSHEIPDLFLVDIIDISEKRAKVRAINLVQKFRIQQLEGNNEALREDVELLQQTLREEGQPSSHVTTSYLTENFPITRDVKIYRKV